MAGSAPQDLRVLAFDVFGTVVDWRTGVITELTVIAKERRLTLDAPTLADAWRRCLRPSLDRVRHGEVPWSVMDEVHRASLRDLGSEFSLEKLTEADFDRLVLAWHRLPPWPDAVPGLTSLRAHYVLSALSNGGMAMLVDLARSAQLPFDCILSAELVKTYKPDPRVYQLVSSLLRVAPEQAMMVACHADDLAAAAGQGMRTAFVRRPQEWGTGKSDDPDFPVDVVADDFNDLASQLRA
jgi:2-haloacid dehalogenase